MFLLIAFWPRHNVSSKFASDVGFVEVCVQRAVVNFVNGQTSEVRNHAGATYNTTSVADCVITADEN
jgi:hypothetical protein